MAQGKSDDTLNLILIGVGAWLLWEYVISPWIASQQAASSQAGQTGGATVTYQPVTTTTQPAPTPTVNNTLIAARWTPPAGTTGYTAPNLASRYTAAQLAAMEARRAGTTVVSSTQNADGSMTVVTSDGTRTTTQTTKTGGTTSTARSGVGAVVPSWPAGGGVAFNHFIPGGGMTFGGANAWGSPAYGVMESLPKHGWIQ